MNKKSQKPDSLIFDIDGTLFETESILDTAHFTSFKELKDAGLYTGEIPPVEKMYSLLGMVNDDIWSTLLPNTTKEAIEFIDQRYGEVELEEIKKGNGRLYPNVKETIAKLHEKGYRLFIASNGQEDYVKAIVKYCGLAPYIEGIYSAGEFNTSTKVDLVKILLEKHQPKNAWMVGDRSSDVEAGKKNNLLVVGCDYASFKEPGELNGADIIIHEFKEILEYL